MNTIHRMKEQVIVSGGWDRSLRVYDEVPQEGDPPLLRQASELVVLVFRWSMHIIFGTQQQAKGSYSLRRIHTSSTRYTTQPKNPGCGIVNGSRSRGKHNEEDG